MDWKEELSAVCRDVVFGEDMKKHTSFRIGGAAEAMAVPQTAEEAASVMRFCRRRGLPLNIIGNGSNLLVSDDGIRGVVMRLNAMCKTRIEGEEVYAQSGILLSSLANRAAEAGLSGLEFAAGIPGTLGGGIFMNAGAYGGELKDVIVSVEYLDEDGRLCTAGAEELDLGYRHSMFSDRKCAVMSCRMRLKKGDTEAIRAEMAELSRRRREKQPLELPSAGSTFKRPPGHFAGKLIQDAGLSGYSVGGAQVSVKHAGFVVNTGEATAADVLALIAHVQKTVKDKFGVDLEPEVRIIK